jgi:hypothetical protein
MAGDPRNPFRAHVPVSFGPKFEKGPKRAWMEDAFAVYALLLRSIQKS